MKSWIGFAVIVTLIAFLVSGCGSSAGPQKTTQTATSVSGTLREGDFSVTLVAEPRSAAAGKGFSLTLSIRNLSDKSRSFELSSGQAFDFLTFNSEGAQVWRWSDGMMFTQALGTDTIEAGGVKDFKASWDASGMSAGKYSVEGYYLGLKNIKPRVPVTVSPGQ